MRLILAAALAGTVGASSAARAADQMLPAEIMSQFGTGKPFVAKTLGGKANIMTLQPDGTATVRRQGAADAVTGTWRVSDDGYCSKWNGGKESCFLLLRDGKGFNVTTPYRKLVARWLRPDDI